jgi:hypothetical protein
LWDESKATTGAQLDDDVDVAGETQLEAFEDTQDAGDPGNEADDGEDSEEDSEARPRKARKLQKGETRDAIQAAKKKLASSAGGCQTSTSVGNSRIFDTQAKVTAAVPVR